MIDLFKLILGVLASLFRSGAKLEAEILVLRQQINVLRRRASKRPHLNNTDRFLFVWLYRWFPSVLGAIAIVRPETIVRWHRAGFRAYWRWRSRNRVGRPKVSIELRTLIGEMSCANRLWGAPRIHGELLKLGFEVAQSTVARYMCRRFGPPSQGWRMFLSNHADGIAAVDLFVLPTVAFQILDCLVILRHGRRFWMSFGVASNPTAEWISRQITEAFPWDHAPEYLIRDRDRSYGSVFVRCLCAMGIRDRPIAPRSPWQNAYVERLIGTIRRECLDHIIVFGETHLRRIVGAYAAYYNEVRGPIDLWTRTPRSIAPFSASAPSHHNLSSADFIINIAEFEFSVHTGLDLRRGVRALSPASAGLSLWVRSVLAGFNPLWLDLNLAGAGFDLSLDAPPFQAHQDQTASSESFRGKRTQNHGALPERRELWLCSKGPTEKET